MMTSAALGLGLLCLVIGLMLFARKPDAKWESPTKKDAKRPPSTTKAGESRISAGETVTKSPTSQNPSAKPVAQALKGGSTDPLNDPLGIPRLNAFDDIDDEEKTGIAETITVEEDKLELNFSKEGSFLPLFFDDEAREDTATRAERLFDIVVAAKTDRGKKRKINEDSIAVVKKSGIFAVADGMGGHNGGEVASSLACEAVKHMFESGLDHIPPAPNLPRRASAIAKAIAQANADIYAMAQSENKLKEMGTTMVVVHFTPNKRRMYVGHVGDSRAYRVRGGAIEQMTKDHNLAELGVQGAMGQRLHRAVGIAPHVTVDVIMGEPQIGDIYLLCSDGLTKMLKDDEMRVVLEKNAGNPDGTVEELVDLANARGGVDNVSVVVVEVRAA